MGFIYGARWTLTQMYAAEIAHPDIRGLLTSLPIMSLSLGTLFTNSVGERRLAISELLALNQ